jgi:chorismate mutase/prephenate dehydratase
MKDAKKISICFSLPHKSGTLYGMLGHFIENDLNMTSIESSPRKGSSWEYNFFITFDGNLSEENTKKALSAIEKDSLDYKLLGNY